MSARIWTAGTALAAMLAVPGVCVGQVGAAPPPDAQPGAVTGARSGTAATTTQSGASPVGKEAKPAPPDGGLTFLPELKPTDGVKNLAEQKNGSAELAAQAGAMHEQPILLDRAVAVINGEVILASDVHEQQEFAVFEPLSAPSGAFTPMQAMRQLVNRTLLLQQMAEQQMVPMPSDAEVNAQIADLRKHIPACANQSCETEAGWRRFLAARGFTEEELRTHWQQRMQILNFVGVRFRSGIRITKPEIETYYKEQLVPQLKARKVPPPPLTQVSTRIEEVLLQQHVNVLLGDYLRSLKDAGSVLILDPAYNALGTPASANAISANTQPEGGEP